MYALNFLLKMLERCFYLSRNRFKLKEGGLTLQLPQPVYQGGSDANWKVKTLKTGSGVGDGRVHSGKRGGQNRSIQGFSFLRNQIISRPNEIQRLNILQTEHFPISFET